MKKILLLLLGISFLILSFSSNTLESVAFNRELEIEQEGCPECKAEYFKCLEVPDSIYMQAINKAAEKLKRKEITKEDYDAVCEVAYSIRGKSVTECDAIFEKCCLEE